MNHSSTQVPFAMAAFIAVLINSVFSGPEKPSVDRVVQKVPERIYTVLTAMPNQLESRLDAPIVFAKKAKKPL